MIVEHFEWKEIKNNKILHWEMWTRNDVRYV